MKKLSISVCVVIVIGGLLIWFKLPLFTIYEGVWSLPKKVTLKEYIKFQNNRYKINQDNFIKDDWTYLD